MTYRSILFALATGFGILIALNAALAIGAIRKADAMYQEMQVAQDSNLRAEYFRRGIATDTYLADILLQDYLLDPGLGTLVALLTVHRVGILEKRHDTQRQEIEESQNNLRRLSQRLVQAQEGERKVLSRELHDEVGQMMTALGIELGNPGNLHEMDGAAFRARMEDAKRLNADVMRAIRDLAMDLRPSMLDDLGLEAALEWQGREFSRRTGVPANVEVNGALDYLSDAQRTCIYRVVQETLTNCARHANASNVGVSVSSRRDGVAVRIHDDGDGFNVESHEPRGLGLLGIRERVQALEGAAEISSKLKAGTTIRVQIPLRAAS